MPAPEWRPTPGLPAAPDRLRGLLEAHRTITSDLSLSTRLTSILRVACELVGTSYGAIGVIGADGSFGQFIHYSTDDLTDPVGPQPAGDSRGPHRPATQPAAMMPLLGVPVRVGDTLVGQLHLASPARGQFSPADEEVITSIAAIAGAAIRAARQLEDAQRAGDALRAVNEIARTTVASDSPDVLTELLAQARRTVGADSAALVGPDEDDQLQVSTSIGPGAAEIRAAVAAAESAIGRAILAGDGRLIAEVSGLTEAFDRPGDRPGDRPDQGLAMLAPAANAGRAPAALVFTRAAGQLPFTARDLDLAQHLAVQLTLARNLTRAGADAARLDEAQARTQQAEELHDSVMQHLFAIGVGLQGIADGPLAPEIAERLRRHITDLDETIDRIRLRVFGSGTRTVGHPPSGPSSNVAARTIGGVHEVGVGGPDHDDDSADRPGLEPRSAPRHARGGNDLEL